MTENQDYQLESMEDAAVKKTQTAKRVLAGVGLAAAGAGAAFAGTRLADNGDTPEEDALTAEDLEGGADAGTITEEVVEEPEPEPVKEVHHYHHYEEAKPAPAPEPEPDIEFNKTTYIVNEDGSMSIVDEGHYDNHDFAVVDYDGDGHGDVLMYDANGNNIYEDDEMVLLRHGEYTMGQGEHIAVVGVDPDPEPYYIDPVDPVEPRYIDDNLYVEEKHDIDDIDNDYNQHTGENYNNDLAQNNQDYNNNGDVNHYQASRSDEYYDNQYGNYDGNDGLASASMDTPTDSYESYESYESYDSVETGAQDDYANNDYNDYNDYNSYNDYNEPVSNDYDAGYGNDMAYDDMSGADNFDVI